MTRFIGHDTTPYTSPWNTDPWEPIRHPDMSPREFAHYRANVQELARQSGQSPDEIVQFIEEWNDVVLTSAELERKIVAERRKLELSNLKAKLDRFDNDLKTEKNARRVELSNTGRPDDLSDPKYLRAAGGSVPDEPRWQADRRAEEARNLAHTRSVGERAGTGTVRKHEEVDLASVRASSGVIRAENLSDPNHPFAPEHVESSEFDGHTFMDGTSPAEVFIERHGWKLSAGNGAGK